MWSERDRAEIIKRVERALPAYEAAAATQRGFRPL